jgi:hypothetical protein
MHSSHIRLIATSALALALTVAASGSSLAQRTKDDGTGGAAGYSPPVEAPDAAAPMDAPAAPMNAPPLPPPDAGASQGAPPPEPIAPDDGTPPSDALPGPDQPD